MFLKNLIWLGLVFSGTMGILHATTCQNLCERFGDPVGCQRLQAGESDCTYPSASTPPIAPPSTVTSPATQTSQPIHRHTLWQDNHGVKTRFALTIADESLDIVGESNIPLDPYEFHFRPARFWGDHLIDADMRCRPIPSGRFYCHGGGRDVTEMIVEYHVQPGGIFSLKLYGVDTSGSEVKATELEVEYASDGQALIITGMSAQGSKTERLPFNPD